MCLINTMPSKVNLERTSSDPSLSKVSFASVQVREYHRILGDNPSVSSGPPISMSWNYDQDSSGDCTVDEWENKRYSERRSKSEMRVPQEVRTDWLIDAGYSVTQVRDVVHTIKKEKQEWMSSVNKSNLQDKADDMTEKVKRRLARLGGRRERTDVLYTQWISSQDKQKIESTGEQPNRGHSFKLSRRATA